MSLSRLATAAERAVRNVHDALAELRDGADVAVSVVLLRGTAESKLVDLRTELGRRWLTGDTEKMRGLLAEHLDRRFLPFSLGALTLEEIARLEQVLGVAAMQFAEVEVRDTEPVAAMPQAMGGE